MGIVGEGAASSMRVLLKALFGLLLIALLLWRLDLHAIVAALARYRWPWVLGALALMWLSWPLAAVRWRIFASRFAFSRLLELTLIGQFYSIVLPGQLAGEVVKAWRLGKGNADAERLAATVLIDRIIGLLALVVVACTGLVLSRHWLPAGLPIFFCVVAVLLIVGVFALNLAPLHALAVRVACWLERTRFKRIAQSLQRVIDAWREFGRSPRQLVANLLLAVAFQLLGVAVFFLLSRNLGIALPFSDWAWIVGVVSLAILIPVSVGGIGLREGALVGCLGFLGIAGEKALALSLGVFALTMSGALAGGVIEAMEITRRRVVRRQNQGDA